MTAYNFDDLFAQWDGDDRPGGVAAVVQHGTTVYAKAFGMADLERGVPLAVESVFDIASISKQFVACCALLLANEGQLDLDADIRTYLPELPAHDSPVTVRHLFHHTGGLPEYLDLMALGGYLDANDYPARFVVDLLSRRRALNFTPGERFSYSNTGYFLLGEIVARVAGMKLGDYARQAIFTPLGMIQTQFYDDFHRIVPQRAIGYHALPDGRFATELYLFTLVGDGGILTTVGDLARWDANFYANQLPGGAALIDHMLATQPFNNGEPNTYAAGLNHDHYRGLTTVHHAGGWAGYRSFLVRFPDARTSVIVLSNRTDLDPVKLAYQIADRVLADRLAPEITETSPENASVEPAVVDALTGIYRSLSTGNLIEIAAHEGGLVYLHPSGFSAALQPQSDRRYTASNMALDFVPDAGPADAIDLTLGDGTHARLERLRQRMLSDAELAAYSGRYACAELDLTYRLAVEGDRLVAYLPRELNRVALKPSIHDEFNGPLGTWRFARSATGDITGFAIQMGDLHGVEFSRQP